MKDLFEAFEIFKKYWAEDEHSPFHCEHDTLFI